MALFDLLMGAMGQPDPRMRIAQAFGQAPGGPGSPAGPQPLAGAQAAAQAPPVGGAAPPPPAGAGPPGGAPGGPPQGPPAAPPQPQAYQSPPDLVSMYMQLAQRQQASESFDRHLGLLAASAYPGRRPDIVLGGMTDPHQDIGGMMGNVLQLQQYAQNQQRYQDMITNPAPYAKSLNMDVDSFRTLVSAAGPAGAGEAISKIAETQAGVGGSPAWAAQLRAERALTTQGKPIPWTPGDPSSYDAWTKANAAATVAEAKDAQTDKDAFTAADSDYRQTEQLLAWLKAHPEATAAAVQNGALAAGRTGQFREWLGSLPGGLPPDTATAAGFIGQLQGKLYSSAWSGRGGRLSQLEAGKISQGFSQLDNPAMPADQISQQISTLYDKTLTAHANTYGAAGMPTPSPYYNYMDDQYKQGGKVARGAVELDKLGSGSAAGPPGAIQTPGQAGSVQPAPVGAGAGGKPLDDAAKAKAKDLIARDGRDAVIKHLQDNGYDTSGL